MRKAEHIFPFLPYNAHYAFRCAMDADNDKTGEIDIDDGELIHRLLNHSEYFLVLKPLGDLKNDDAFYQFVNEELICGVWKFEEDAGEISILKIVTGGEGTTLLTVSGEVAPECPILFYNWMLENHYDVFGMIPQRQAFDINALND
jgi:hypothetical protein